MYDDATRSRVAAEIARGVSLNSLSKRLGINRSTIREWRDHPLPESRQSDCPHCTSSVPLNAHAYAYLLGLYLGDGCISALKNDVFSLRITCDTKYSLVIHEASEAIGLVRPGTRTFQVNKIGCLDVLAYWKHWPCLFPQHGPGRKHTRPIVLQPWQLTIVRRHPGRLLRGLFHSDGCRITNWTVRPLRAGPKRYEYSRYFFSNESTDIMGICTDALDVLGIAWRMPRPNLLSVARREAVLALDSHVGPKS